MEDRVATSVILPIIPGKEALDRETLQHAVSPGPEHDGYVAARRAQAQSGGTGPRRGA